MITVIGNLVADPEAKNAGGHKLAKLRVATNERVKDASGEWKDGDTTYIDVSCWRRLAENSMSLKKGQKAVSLVKVLKSFTVWHTLLSSVLD
jgi:single-strand DNA-binding protein